MRKLDTPRELDVWTVAVMVRTEHGATRADAFLQGSAVEIECSGWADDFVRGGTLTPFAADLAAARALEELSRRLIDRAKSSYHEELA